MQKWGGISVVGYGMLVVGTLLRRGFGAAGKVVGVRRQLCKNLREIDEVGCQATDEPSAAYGRNQKEIEFTL